MNKSRDIPDNIKKFFSLAVLSAAELKMFNPDEAFCLIDEDKLLINPDCSWVFSFFHIFDSQLDSFSFEV